MLSSRKQTESKSVPLLSTISATNIEYEDIKSTKSCKKLFPLLDILLSICPMWVTQNRSHPCVNIIGVSFTFIGAVSLCIWRYNGNTFIKEHLDSNTNYWILQSLATTITPIQIFAQIMFYAKYFRYKFTTDPRDNYIIKFIKLKHDKGQYQDNDDEIIHKFSCFERYSDVTDYLSLGTIKAVIIISTIIAWIAMFIADYWHWRDPDEYDRFTSHLSKAIIVRIMMYSLYLIPMTLHSIVIFLYLLDWKLRIRYLWQYSFKHKIESNNLVDYYDNFRNSFLEQILWIKVWMIANLILVLVGFWIWMQLIVDSWRDHHYRSITIGQGVGNLVFYALIPILCWIVAASITMESTCVYTKTIQYLKQYHSKLENNELVDDENHIHHHNVTLSLNVVHIKNGNDENEDDMDIMDTQKQLKQIQRIQQIQTFLLFYSDNGCGFSILGIDISYNALLTLVVGFIGGKIIDWAVKAANL